MALSFSPKLGIGNGHETKLLLAHSSGYPLSFSLSRFFLSPLDVSFDGAMEQKVIDHELEC